MLDSTFFHQYIFLSLLVMFVAITVQALPTIKCWIVGPRGDVMFKLKEF